MQVYRSPWYSLADQINVSAGEERRTQDSHSRHHKEAEMSLKAALAPLLVCLVSGAPYNEAQTAPQTKSVSCRTEYSVVWDTQYQEKEQTECVTNYEKVCHTVNQQLCKVRIDWRFES